MTFLNLEYLPYILGGLAVFMIALLRSEKKYFKWIEDHWFLRRAFASKLASVFYCAGFALILLALLDLRGPEERVTGKTSDQKTIVLIDASASMLAEDVRPNRFSKAALLAKHFIKKAVGHQVSVVVFSDGQKRIVPFTNDIDLVEARLDTLESLDLDRGGTGLSMAIQESIQYFINAENRPFGNILVLTDAEETDGGLSLDVPEGVSVAVIGIGTAKGAPIPVRNSRGVFQGNKKHQGETVITKLDETFLKKLGEEVEHFKYWVASSYTIPTEEVLSFFSRSMKTKTSKNDFRIRPVLANYLLVPGALALIISFLLKNLRSFAMIFLLIASTDTYPRPLHQDGQKEEPEKTKEILELEKRFAKNELESKGKKKLATELLKNGFPEEAKKLYEEVLGDQVSDANAEDVFNLGAAQFKSRDLKGGMKTYSELAEYLEKNPGGANKELLEKTKKNVLKAIEAQDKSQKGKQDDSKNQKDQNEQEGQSGDSGGEGEKKENSKGQDDQGKEKEKENENGKDDKEKDGENGKKDKDKNRNKDDKDSQGGEKMDKEKMPSILKQLMSDDNQLQKKVIDADTVERKTREKKDW